MSDELSILCRIMDKVVDAREHTQGSWSCWNGYHFTRKRSRLQQPGSISNHKKAAQQAQLCTWASSCNSFTLSVLHDSTTYVCLFWAIKLAHTCWTPGKVSSMYFWSVVTASRGHSPLSACMACYTCVSSGATGPENCG